MPQSHTFHLLFPHLPISSSFTKMDQTYANTMRKRPAEIALVQLPQDALLTELEEMTIELETILAEGPAPAGSTFEVETYTSAQCTATDVKYYGTLGAQVEAFVLPSGYNRSLYTAEMSGVNSTFPTYLVVNTENSPLSFYKEGYNVPEMTCYEPAIFDSIIVGSQGLVFTNAMSTYQKRPYLSSNYTAVAAMTPTSNAEALALCNVCLNELEDLADYWVPFVSQPQMSRFVFTKLSEVFEGLPTTLAPETSYTKRKEGTSVLPSIKTYTFSTKANCAYALSFTLRVARLASIRSLQVRLDVAGASISAFYYGECRDLLIPYVDAMSVIIPSRTVYSTDTILIVDIVGYYEFKTDIEHSMRMSTVSGDLTLLPL